MRGQVIPCGQSEMVFAQAIPLAEIGQVINPLTEHNVGDGILSQFFAQVPSRQRIGASSGQVT